ncbi:uncharacterized protein LOC116614640 isoform X2 [Nematostella vectensis]|uniref:uncharacterized protein LOC116614640 isoform X2 n=1 Tax=Nematostella vectensis TaxID=45351 RepID=UPI00138FE866|nr:uncharacterized protein LOC116614640 isoform X2 [Nematostella vectensis]
MMSGWIEPALHVYEVENSWKNRRTFRAISREICGQSMEPFEGSLVWFGEMIDQPTVKETIVSVGSATPADEEQTNHKKRDYCHQIDFLFVNKDYQDKGYGSLMILGMEEVLRKRKKRPIKVESAIRSVGFFKKLGYHEVGAQMQCIHPSCHLFSNLQPMEKFSEPKM